MKDFYVYLPSNTEFLETNKSYNYVTKLVKEISLSGQWQVCLKEIHYPRTCSTLLSNETSFVFMREIQDTWREVTIDPGYYKSESTVTKAINDAIGDDVTISFAPSSRRIKASIPDHTSIHFNEPLSSMLGIGHGRQICTSDMRRGRYPVDLSRGIDALYVYADIVQSKLVGNTAAPLLAVVPISGSYARAYLRGGGLRNFRGGVEKFSGGLRNFRGG